MNEYIKALENNTTFTDVRESIEQLNEIKSPFNKAANELDKHADKLGKDHMDYDDFKHHANMLKSSNHKDWKSSAESLKHMDTEARDTVLAHIVKHTSKRKEMVDAYYKASGHTQIKEETLEESSWVDSQSCDDGPGKGKKMIKMTELEHVDSIIHHKNQMHQLSTGTHKDQKKLSKQQLQDKYHYHAHKAALHKDALDHHRLYNESVKQIDEAGTAHPIPGHEYHKKPSDHLRYIMKDAHEAAEAIKDHDPKAESKYRDQVNDAATVLHFRKKTGSPDWYKKKYNLKEEVEQSELSELSNELLDRYKKKAGESARAADKAGDFKKGNKRFSGIVKATNKQFDNDMKKEDVDLDESNDDYDMNKVLRGHHDLSQHKLDGLITMHGRVKKDTRLLGDGVKSATLKHISKEIEKRRSNGEKAQGYVITTHPDGTRTHKVVEEVEMINEELNQHMKTLTDTLTQKSKDSSVEGLHTEFSVKSGNKYHKIIGTTNGGKGTQSVHAFVDKETGNLHKAASWNTPAKGARYNLHKDIEHLEKHADQYGSYLYKK